MHAAATILDEILAAVQTELGSDGSAYLHRANSLEGLELPCVCVNYGDDSPDPESATLSELGSSLEVELTAHAVGDTEEEVKAALLFLRAAAHRAIKGASLTATWHVEYAGAARPTLTQSERMVGEYSTRWIVRYQMPINDPG